MLTPKDLHDYQRECILHQLYHDDSMLWLQPGLGKTIITLTSIVDRMRAGQVKKILVFGPLRVIQAVWRREARKWEHTKHLRFSVMHGDKSKRIRALFNNADIYLCNYENMNWLAGELNKYYLKQSKPLPFDMVVYDEISKLKNSTTLRMKGGTRDRKDKFGHVHEIKVAGWRKLIPEFKYRTGLTGTPACNGYLDLHGQYLAIDNGKRLGEYITHYKDSYFMGDYNGWNYEPTDIGKKFIEQLISDVTVKMDAADYLDMPKTKIINMMVDLPAKARKAYEEVEKNMFTQLDTGTEIEVFSKNSISNKTLQFCNGSPYLVPESPEYESLHDAKLDALEEVLEEASGSPVLCSYTFRSDAERIMKRFKKYHPVNLTATKSKDTEKIIDQWNSGKVKLMIGHPACLHPDTLVLTDTRGWIKIVEVSKNEKVFDGIEFVSHSGCSYSGYKEVIDVFGMTMTQNHKLLIDNVWVDACDVRDCEDIKRKALYKYKGDDKYLSKMFTLRSCVGDTSSECNEAQPEEECILSTVHPGKLSQHDKYPYLEYMEWDEAQNKEPVRQKLRGSWNNVMCGMGRFQSVLLGYARHIQGQLDYRTCGCKQELLERELYMGNNTRPTSEQTFNQATNIQRIRDTFSRIMPVNRNKQNDVNYETEPRDDSRRSSTRCDDLALREKHDSDKYCKKKCEKAHVYDLVDCGPRHQFLIKNDAGEVFISHNSMSHGIDGLQDSGSILVWFGLNWSLELYEQMCCRLDRQGQTQSVSIIRILCNDTIDLAVADALERKTDTQEGLKSALQRYRDGITTNALEITFR